MLYSSFRVISGCHACRSIVRRERERNEEGQDDTGKVCGQGGGVGAQQ